MISVNKDSAMDIETSKESILKKPWVVVLIAFICSALWGSAFSGVKIGYDRFGIDQADWASQIIFEGVRFAIAGIMAIAIGSISTRKLLIPKSKGAISKVMIISLFQTILQYFFYYIGLAHTTGVKAAIIVSANVFTAIIISTVIYRLENLSLRKIIGCILGFSGIVIINLSGLKGGFSFDLLGDGFVLISTAANGFSSVLVKKYSVSEEPVMLSGWQFFFGGLIMTLTGVICGGSIGSINMRSVSILLYLAFVSAAAYSLWAMLLKHNPVSKVAVFGFMNPICGVIISSVVLKENNSLGIQAFTALILVCIGIYIVNYKNE